ncbi:MAG: mechanosensitive ion channel family protein [bacterium]|nr:mechanosensitive ion channel family protein [bacterium]
MKPHFPGLSLLLATFMSLMLLTSPLHAQTPDASELTRQTTIWKKLLDKADAEIKKATYTDVQLSEMTSKMEKASLQIKQFIAQIEPFSKDTKILLDKLGKPPKAREPAEAPEVAKQREELLKRFTQTDGATRSATSLLERSEQIRKIVHDLRRNLFSSQILEKGSSPFTLFLWREGVFELSRVSNRISKITLGWSRQHSSSHLALLTLAALATWLILFALMRRGIEFHRAYPIGPPPPFFKRAASAGAVSIIRAMPPIIAAILFYGSLYYFGMLTYPFDILVPVALGAFCAIAAIRAMSTTLLAPTRRLWRIFPVASSVARRLNGLIFAIALIYGVDLFLNALSNTLLIPLSLTILQSAIASVLFAGLLVGILRTPFRAHTLARAKHHSSLTKLLKIPLWLIVIAVLIATALGYISLARFLTQQTVITGSVLIMLYLTHLTIGEFTDSFDEPKNMTSRFLSDSFGFSQQRREQLGAVSMLALNAVLFLTALPFLALQWGFSWQDVISWSRQALFGFEFGGLTISLVSILIALAVFFFGVVFTKIFQRWLDQKILSKNQSKTGAEDSIKTAVGYLGIIISALIALSYTGIGLGNLAIVAGALSLGIGFGLQSIVNNFVSGLILLAERPIKVGDWIAVAGEEGNVRRISVRSTEIETFDRTHIIVPNSELISGTVKNWTLRSPLGRVVINIGVSYEADPDEVHDILLRVATSHPAILEYPEPQVMFIDFGANSLDFSLRAFLSDITNSMTVRSQLRFELLRALREADISIPFPQTDLHLADIDRLEAALRGPRNNQNRSSNKRSHKDSRSGRPSKPPQKT